MSILNTILSGFAPKTKAATTPTQKISDSFDVDKYLKAIAYNETRDKPAPYSFHQPSGKPELGEALGKYQITEEDLRLKAKRYLGRNIKSNEFLASPTLQEMYAKNQAMFRHDAGYTPEQMADLHRSGTGVLQDPLKEAAYRNSKKYITPEYVNSFSKIYNQKLHDRRTNQPKFSPKKNSSCSVRARSYYNRTNERYYVPKSFG